MKPTILTRSGHYFNLLEPETSTFTIEDIAHALSHICRYTGHVHTFYSVAQHSVAVSQLVPPEHALAGLLHDAAEAYVGDMIRPIKVKMKSFQALESDIMGAIVRRFNLFPWYQPSAVKFADNVVCNTERRDLFVDPPDWGPMPGPLPERIEAWGPALAELRFLDRFKEITEGMVS